MTLAEIKACEIFSNTVVWYRDNHDFTRPCWMDEWCFGYFCALRDQGLINVAQWLFLIDVFATPEDFQP